jgi:hypothetical protein
MRIEERVRKIENPRRESSETATNEDEVHITGGEDLSSSPTPPLSPLALLAMHLMSRLPEPP